MLITEDILRSRRGSGSLKELYLNLSDQLTPGARDYIRKQEIEIIWDREAPVAFEGGYTDDTGHKYPKKPEHMTHLHGNHLVAKTHPRIILRGKLDSLQAKVMEGQMLAQMQGAESLIRELEEILAYTRHLMACEVKEEEFAWPILLNMDEAALRQASHNTEKSCGMPFCLPSYRMGAPAVCLNTLRAASREVELAAVAAFVDEGGNASRPDILRALNRLSSALHILYCRQAAATKGEWSLGENT
ncbi:MAG: ATP-binding protein [Oscillospiraceae bacterium]|nr:ATP-binding protein [Oscillospiraceae bacterium]